MLQNRNFPVQRYVCISSRGPLPPLDLELYPRVSQKTINSDLQREVAADGVFRGAHGDRSAEKADR